MSASPVTDLTAEETFESLNGFEEIAIAKHFGAEITTLAEEKPTTFLRALVFTIETRREGVTAPEAKDAAMNLTLKECDEYFTEDPEDPDQSDPDSDVGKGDSSPEGLPMS